MVIMNIAKEKLNNKQACSILPKDLLKQFVQEKVSCDRQAHEKISNLKLTKCWTFTILYARPYQNTKCYTDITIFYIIIPSAHLRKFQPTQIKELN